MTLYDLISRLEDFQAMSELSGPEFINWAEVNRFTLKELRRLSGDGALSESIVAEVRDAEQVRKPEMLQCEACDKKVPKGEESRATMSGHEAVLCSACYGKTFDFDESGVG